MIVGKLKSYIQPAGLMAVVAAIWGILFTYFVTMPLFENSLPYPISHGWPYTPWFADNPVPVFYVTVGFTGFGIIMLGISIYRAIQLKRRVDQVWALIGAGLYVTLAIFVIVVYATLAPPHYTMPAYCKDFKPKNISEGAVCARPT